MSELEQKRAELARKQAGEPEVYVCEEHGERTTIVCMGCYAVQQERVERESPALRERNTTENLRKWVLEELAKRNGQKEADGTT